MSILPSILSPGATVLSTDGVTADRLSFIAATTGLVLLGYKVSLQSGQTNGRGQLFHDTNASNIATTCITTFELVTGVNNVQEFFYSAPGLNIENGLSIDFIAGGTFDVTVYHKTVT